MTTTTRNRIALAALIVLGIIFFIDFIKLQSIISNELTESITRALVKGSK